MAGILTSPKASVLLAIAGADLEHMPKLKALMRDKPSVPIREDGDPTGLMGDVVERVHAGIKALKMDISPVCISAVEVWPRMFQRKSAPLHPP